MKLKVSKIFLAVLISFLLLGAGYFFFSRTSNKTVEKSKSKAEEIVVYKSPNCQCCEFWAYYARRNGYKVKIVNVDNIEEIKKKYSVPASLQACHTSIVKGYVIEGHVPIEAVNKLLSEKPKVKGISLPGMPTGSPGMGGFKKGLFEIYSFGEGGVVRYMTL